MDTCKNPNCCGGKPATSDDPLMIEKRVFFWNIKITNPFDLRKYNYWSIIPVSISKEGVKKILALLGVLDKVPEELIRPIYIPDIGNASVCFGCGQKKLEIGK